MLLPTGFFPISTHTRCSVQNGQNFRCLLEKTYDKVFAFRLALDGTVTLLRRLPAKFLPSDNTADRYDPLAKLQPGPVTEMPYLRYPFWAHRPTDLFDMNDGVLLGQGWSPLEMWEGKPSRLGFDGAEVIVNPLGQPQRRLCFRMEGRLSGRLEALDLENKVVATAGLEGGPEVTLTVPTDPARLHLLRLRVTQSGKAVRSFRVFCPGTELADFQQPPRQPSDIAIGNLSLGKNWYPLEHYAGRTFRWVANDAEIILEDLPAIPRDLLLDLEPGFGLAGQPCRLTIQDQKGKTVATACVRGREVLRLKLSPTTSVGTVLRLHVEGGGHQVPNDLRILNFRVYRCQWD